MLFNSYAFLFIYLPVTLIGYQIAGRFHRKAVVAWLGLMSCVFYAYWHPAFLFVLLGSIALNFLSSSLISRHIPNRVPTIVLLWSAIALNLLALGYFKYFFPLLNFFAGLSGSHPGWENVALPLGISFFTFTQIAYLVDLQQGVAKQQDIISYVLFVTFFPHLIAGPILHHKDMMPQFQQDRRYRLRADDLAVGFSWFILGLCKKVLLADTFAKTADAVFATTGVMAPGFAWRGVLCYTLQLYFDFSGYSDMALGLARMLSIDFPLNFNSPYKASSMIDFWQRWHITLSQYINSYLFTPLQLLIRSRRRAANKPVNRAALSTPAGFASMIAGPTLISMFIAGIWHGAGTQFLLYGIMHGIFITINHAWNMARQNRENKGLPGPSTNPTIVRIRHTASVLLTFTCVMSTFIFFRANSTGSAFRLIRSMFAGYRSAAWFPVDTHIAVRTTVLYMAIGFAICWFLPNTQQILCRFKPSLHPELVQAPSPAIAQWKPAVGWALALGFLFFFALVRLQVPSTFLYFQF